MQCIEKIRIVKRYLNALGIRVIDTDEHSEYDSEEHMIYLSNAYESKCHRLYALLHEAGHAHEALDREHLPDGYYYHPCPHERLREEERRCWDYGWTIGERLRLDLDKEDYFVYANECLKCYE